MIQPTFSTTTDVHDTAAVLTVRGELDLATAPTLASAVHGCIDGGCSTIDVDLGHVTFFSCAGINVLIEGRLRGIEAGARLRVVRPSGIVARVMTMTRTHGLTGTWEPDGIAVRPLPGRVTEGRAAAGSIG